MEFEGLSAEQLQLLIDRVTQGEKLETAERRKALKAIRQIRPGTSTAELARMLGVSPSAIVKDLEVLKAEEESAPALKIGEDKETAIAELRRSADEAIARLEAGLPNLKQGCREYTTACKTIQDIRTKLILNIAKLQEGVVSVDPHAWDYVCNIPDSKTGFVITRHYSQLEPEEQEYNDAVHAWSAAKEKYAKWEKENGRGMPDRESAWCRSCDGVRKLDPANEGKLVCGHPDPCYASV